MDPDANFAEQQQILARAYARTSLPEDGERLAELVIALDDWLRSGGFPPKGMGQGQSLVEAKAALHHARQVTEEWLSERES